MGCHYACIPFLFLHKYSKRKQIIATHLRWLNMWCFHTSRVGLPVPWLVAIHRTRHALNSQVYINKTHSLILEQRSFRFLLINTISVCPIIRSRAQKWATSCCSKLHLDTTRTDISQFLDIATIITCIVLWKQLAQKRLLDCAGWSASLFSNSVIRFYHDSAQYYVSGYHIMYCRSNNINNAKHIYGVRAG